MSWLSGATELVAGGWLSSAYPGLGATGAVIKAAGATGEHGAGVGLNDGLLDASEYLFEVAAQPAGGTVVFSELGQATLTVTADGAYAWTYRLREDGAYVGGPIAVTTTIGGATLTLAAANCSQANACGTGAVTVAAPSAITLFAASCAGAASCTTAAAQIATLGDGLYCTMSGLVERAGQTEIAQLTDPAAGITINAITVARAMADADALIDARLAPRYALPLAYVPMVLVRVAADIARYFLWDVRASEQVRQRYKDAISLLDKIAVGQVDLPGATVLAPAAGAVTVVARAPARQFSDAVLGAFGGLGR